MSVGAFYIATYYLKVLFAVDIEAMTGKCLIKLLLAGGPPVDRGADAAAAEVNQRAVLSPKVGAEIENDDVAPLVDPDPRVDLRNAKSQRARMNPRKRRKNREADLRIQRAVRVQLRRNPQKTKILINRLRMNPRS